MMYTEQQINVSIQPDDSNVLPQENCLKEKASPLENQGQLVESTCSKTDDVENKETEPFTDLDKLDEVQETEIVGDYSESASNTNCSILTKDLSNLPYPPGYSILKRSDVRQDAIEASKLAQEQQNKNLPR